jgi:hypothetical protein
MMHDMNIEFEYQIRRHLQAWLTSATVPTAPVQQAPLNPDGSTGPPTGSEPQSGDSGAGTVPAQPGGGGVLQLPSGYGTAPAQSGGIAPDQSGGSAPVQLHPGSVGEMPPTILDQNAPYQAPAAQMPPYQAPPGQIPPYQPAPDQMPPYQQAPDQPQPAQWVIRRGWRCRDCLSWTGVHGG